MLKRMWRAFWAAMREPVNAYAPKGPALKFKVQVDAVEATERLDALLAKAERLRELGEIAGQKWRH